MKNIFYLIICSILLLSGCYDREIIDSKEGDPIDPVTNLTYTINGDNVNVSWTLPTQFPPDIILPVSVMIKVYKDNILVSTVTIPDAPTTYNYNPYDSASPYRIIIKVQGSVDTDDPNKSKLRYSPGETVVF